MRSVFIVFLTGIVIGLFFGLICYRVSNVKLHPSVLKYHNSKNLNNDLYDTWFNKNTNYTRKVISNDNLKYGGTKYNLESLFLYKEVPVLCVMKISRLKNAIAANNTWLTHCNERFFYDSPHRNMRYANNSQKFNNSVTSSWHLLCNSMLQIQKNYKQTIKYVIFVNDDTFVIPENLRMILAGLNNNSYVYMGHAISFWGVTYNVAQSGIVLGMNVIERLTDLFKNSEECQNSGKYWKQEDWYLGKYLASLNILPINPNNINSNQNLTRFHGYSLEQSMFPGSQKVLTKYYKNWIHPAECCSMETVTFNAVEADKIYQYNYLIYQLRLFSSGKFGLTPAYIPLTEEQVWRSAVKEFSDTLDSKGAISSVQYAKMWEKILNNNSNDLEKLKKGIL